MGRRAVLWGVWIGFIGYVLLFAPPLQPDTFQPLQTLLSGQIPSINPVLISLFSLIGIWILIYSALIFIDGRMQLLPAWRLFWHRWGQGYWRSSPTWHYVSPINGFQAAKIPG